MSDPTVKIREWNGDSTKTDKTNGSIVFRSVDTPTVDSSAELNIPSGSNVKTYSWEKWVRLYIDTGTAAQRLSNLKFYTDGGRSFNNQVFVFGPQSADITQTFRSTSQLLTSNNPPQGGSGSKTMTTVFVYTSNGAYSLSSAAETFSGTATDIGNFLVMCMRVDSSASSGLLSSETFSFSYDSLE